MKTLVFTIILIGVFIFFYVKNTGINNLSITKMLFIPILLILAYFIDKKLEKKK